MCCFLSYMLRIYLCSSKTISCKHLCPRSDFWPNKHNLPVYKASWKFPEAARNQHAQGFDSLYPRVLALIGITLRSALYDF